MGNIGNRMNKAGQSVSDLMKGLNLDGKVQTGKQLYMEPPAVSGIKAGHFEYERQYEETLKANGYNQSTIMPAKPTIRAKAKSAPSAPIEVQDADIIGPEKFVFAGANGKLQIRIDQAVIDLYERQNDKKSQLVQAALVEYAQRHKLA